MSVPVRVARLILRGDLPVSALRPFVDPPPPATPAVSQLSLWIRDATGYPERPWCLTLESRFDCVALACRGMRVATCVARQRASDSQRTRDTWRGQGSEYPTCTTERCAQGRAIRQAVEARSWIPRGAEPFLGPRKPPRRALGLPRHIAEMAARRRLERVGLLDEPPTIDAEPEGDEEARDGEVEP